MLRTSRFFWENRWERRMSGSDFSIVFFAIGTVPMRAGFAAAPFLPCTGQKADGMQTVRGSGTLGLRLYALGERL